MPARNSWSSISFSWGKHEQVPTETLPGLPPATPCAWSSHKENCHYSPTQLAPKPWKTSGEKKMWLFLISLHRILFLNPREMNRAQPFACCDHVPSCPPPPAFHSRLSLWTSAFTSLPHHALAKCSFSRLHPRATCISAPREEAPGKAPSSSFTRSGRLLQIMELSEQVGH